MELSLKELDLKSATVKIPEDGDDPYRKSKLAFCFFQCHFRGFPLAYVSAWSLKLPPYNFQSFHLF